jgi:hypothetical protein
VYSIKIIENETSDSGHLVRWEVIQDSQTILSLAANFSRKLDASQLKEAIAASTEIEIARAAMPDQTADLSAETGIEINLDDFKPVPTLEVAQVDKAAEIDTGVQRFIERKGDGNPRYTLLGLIAMVASTISIVDKLRHATLTTQERDDLKARLARIRSTWAWVEQAFQRQLLAKQDINNLGDPKQVLAYELAISDLEVSDPDVYLTEVWDKIEDEV